MTRGQAERLMPLAEEVLAEAGVAPRDLTAVAVCTGPGNFTGVRIAVAAARGLSLSLGIPAVGVPRPFNFAVTAACLTPGAFGALAAVPTRRGEIHAELFAADEPPAGAHELSLRASATGTPDAVVEALRPAVDRMRGPIVATGEDADFLSARLGLLLAGPGAQPTPVHVALWGQALIDMAAADDRPLPRPAPVYLRPADAAPSSDLPPAIIGG